jgi:hypothetical protein
MTLSEAFAASTKRGLNAADVKALLSVHPGVPEEALDRIALQIAHLYAMRQVDFVAADAVANVMFAFATQHACLGSTLHAVFLAFDAGEFMPPNARKGANPEAEYTRPQIAKIIAGSGRSNKSLERTRGR